jgi:hypothetical protein
VVPAKVVPGAVSMLADCGAQPLNLGNQVISAKMVKILVHYTASRLPSCLTIEQIIDSVRIAILHE